MHTYVIERTLPGAGKLSPADLQGVAAKSNGVLRALGPDVQWVQSYVTGDKIYCVYRARSADLILEHGRSGGFPVDSIAEVTRVIDPTTAGER
jgi:hypothetical protein